MSSESRESPKYTRITGTNAFGQPLEKFYTADVATAERAFLLAPADQGGAVSWSTEVVDELPERCYICCPHCDKKVINPNLLVEQ
tara:strand:- start:15027 stop:15281 length:255 start_codon:yes stop_codon:yes gene_type:complete